MQEIDVAEGIATTNAAGPSGVTTGDTTEGTTDLGGTTGGTTGVTTGDTIEVVSEAQPTVQEQLHNMAEQLGCVTEQLQGITARLRSIEEAVAQHIVRTTLAQQHHVIVEEVPDFILNATADVRGIPLRVRVEVSRMQL